MTLLQQLGLQAVHDAVDLLRGNRALLARAEEAVQDLLAAEGLAAPILLDDEKRRRLDRFVGRETLVTRQTLAAAPDGLALLRGSRVDDLVFQMPTGGTLHSSTPAATLST